MARPKGRNGKPKRLYLDPKVTGPADKIAFQRDQSLSEMVELLLQREIDREKRKTERAKSVQKEAA